MNWLLETTSGINALRSDPGGAVIAIIPGDDVALHHLWLNATAPARRLDEARSQLGTPLQSGTMADRIEQFFKAPRAATRQQGAA